MKSQDPIALLDLSDASELWMRSPAHGLKFIKDADGRLILHEPWSSNRGHIKWRPVPTEEEGA